MVNIAIYGLLKERKKNSFLQYFLSYSFGVLPGVFAAQLLFEGSVHGTNHKDFFHFHLLVFIAINTVVIILQNLTLVKEKNVLVESENMQLRTKNIEAANQQLKQQVQPHFLFNSLSTLKALIKQQPVQAEEYLVRLSSFLRYTIAANQPDKAKVEDEVKLCVDYLEMQQIRFGNALQFSIDIPAEVQQDKDLPVFALQILAENAIKHNTLTIANPLHITITYSDNAITVANNLQPKESTEYSAGMGLNNLSERYKLLSAEGVTIQKTETTFMVTINTLP